MAQKTFKAVASASKGLPKASAHIKYDFTAALNQTLSACDVY